MIVRVTVIGDLYLFGVTICHLARSLARSRKEPNKANGPDSVGPEYQQHILHKDFADYINSSRGIPSILPNVFLRGHVVKLRENALVRISRGETVEDDPLEYDCQKKKTYDDCCDDNDRCFLGDE